MLRFPNKTCNNVTQRIAKVYTLQEWPPIAPWAPSHHIDLQAGQNAQQPSTRLLQLKKTTPGGSHKITEKNNVNPSTESLTGSGQLMVNEVTLKPSPEYRRPLKKVHSRNHANWS